MTAASARLSWYPFAGLYALLTIPLIHRFQYSLYPDATSYLSIAEAYSRGEFWHAVNGYWAPLYCWLLAPLLLAGVDNLLAPKLLSLAIGVAALAGLWRLCDRLELPPALSRVVLIAAIPSLVYWSVSYVTPDFLLVCVLTWYLSVVVDRRSVSSLRGGVAAGALGGLAYLAKQYAMPFVAAHLALTALLRWAEDRSPARAASVTRWTIAAYIVFLAVSSPWIAAMTSKYGRLTISAAGTYNWYLHGPGGGSRYNVGTRGLAAPPFPGAVSAWVDPTTYVKYDAWQADSPSQATWHKVRQVLTTGGRAVVVLEKFTILAVPVLLTGLLLFVGIPRSRPDLRSGYLAVTVLLFFSGYVLIATEILERLVWVTVIVLSVLAARIAARAGVPRWPSWTRLVVYAAFVGSVWFLPARRTIQEIDDGRHLRELAHTLATTNGLEGRIATLNRYADSLRISFLTGTAFYGRVSQQGHLDQVLSDLRSHDIDYLLIWTYGESPGNGSIAQELRRRFSDVTRGRSSELSVLDVKPDQERVSR